MSCHKSTKALTPLNRLQYPGESMLSINEKQAEQTAGMLGVGTTYIRLGRLGVSDRQTLPPASLRTVVPGAANVMTWQ